MSARNGDNVTMIASSIQDAINAVPTLPFTASSSAGVVTLTARHKGLCGNEIPVSLNYYGFGGGEVLPAGVQIAVATGTAGTGAPVLTGAVAAMADEPFDYIGLPFNDTASVNTLVPPGCCRGISRYFCRRHRQAKISLSRCRKCGVPGNAFMVTPATWSP